MPIVTNMGSSRSVFSYRLPRQLITNTRRSKPTHSADRAATQRDQKLSLEIQRVWDENFQVYGARKVRRQLNREGIRFERLKVERLMKLLGLKGVRRGRKCRTTVADSESDRPADLVHRLRYSERLAEAGMVASVGSVGDSYDNALG